MQKRRRRIAKRRRFQKKVLKEYGTVENWMASDPKRHTLDRFNG
jgi:hypothetical protein